MGIVSPSSLPSVLAARAVRHGEEPWLFYRREQHWRWLSWGQLADQVARGAARLRGSAIAAESNAPLGYACCPPAAAVAVDLALQAAGLAGMACGGEPAAARHQAEQAGCAGWLEVAEDNVSGSPVSPALPTLRLPTAQSRLRRWQGQTLAPDARLSPPSWTALLDWSKQFPANQERWVAHSGVGLEQPVGRALLAWSLLTGAALALPPAGAELVADLLWTRPHLVFAPAAELSLLATALEDRRHRRSSRLLVVSASDGGVLSDQGQAAVWDRLGVLWLPPPPSPSP